MVIKPMRYIYAVIIILALGMLGNTASAIERTRTPNDSTRAADNRPHYTPDKSAMDKRNDKPRDRKDYDDFVDRNNNGIDDRAEQQVDQQESEEKKQDDSKEDRPRTDDSTQSNRDGKSSPRGR